MAVRMFCVIFLAIAIFGHVHGAGELDILYSPDSLKFVGHEHLKASLVKEVFSASLGFSIEHGSDWPGLVISDPFASPEAVVGVYIDGISSLGAKAHLKGHKYPLVTDENEWNTWDSLHRRITQRFPDGENKLVNINLSEGPEAVHEYSNIFGELKLQSTLPKKGTWNSLKPQINEEDYNFLTELELLKELTQRIAKGIVVVDNVVDFYWIQFRSLHALSDFHGADSTATKEAKMLLGDALMKLKDAFRSLYDGDVLVAVVSSDSSHTRRARSLLEVKAIDLDTLNLADTYTDDYPVIFNIIFWFTIVLIFTLISVTYTIGYMDPGRDSIIYRMTSNRMKKD